jgi:hypothetical protein
MQGWLLVNEEGSGGRELGECFGVLECHSCSLASLLKLLAG